MEPSSKALLSDGVTVGLLHPSPILHHPCITLFHITEGHGPPWNQTPTVSTKSETEQGCEFRSGWLKLCVLRETTSASWRPGAWLLQHRPFINSSTRQPEPFYFWRERSAQIRNNPWVPCFTFKGKRMVEVASPAQEAEGWFHCCH